MSTEVNEYKDKIKRLEIELETSKREAEIFQQQKSKMLSTTAFTGSVVTSGVKETSEIVHRERVRENYSPEHTKYTTVETYQSAIERKYVSPSSVKSR